MFSTASVKCRPLVTVCLVTAILHLACDELPTIRGEISIPDLVTSVDKLEKAFAAIDVFGVKKVFEEVKALRAENDESELALKKFSDTTLYYLEHPEKVPRYRVTYSLRGHTKLTVSFVDSTGTERGSPVDVDWYDGTTPDVVDVLLTNKSFMDFNLEPGTYELVARCVDVAGNRSFPPSTEVTLQQLDASGPASPRIIVGHANLQPHEEARWRIVVPDLTASGGAP